MAASKGQLEVVSWLVTHGARIDACSDDKWQPHHAASFAGQEEVVKFLLERGALPQVKTKPKGGGRGVRLHHSEICWI